MNWICRIRRLEGYLDAKFQAFRSRWFEAQRAKAFVDGQIVPTAGRTRMDAVIGSIHSFPYMLWTVRRQIWTERAFQYEAVFISLGMLLGLVRGFDYTQWTVTLVLGLYIFLAEANNTASEMKLKYIQFKHLGGLTFDPDIGDIFEFAALPVAMVAWPWGVLWVLFMINPG